MRITNKEDFAIISNRPELKGYLENKTKTMSDEYNVDYFEAIGCFVILENEEDFPSEEELEENKRSKSSKLRVFERRT